MQQWCSTCLACINSQDQFLALQNTYFIQVSYIYCQLICKKSFQEYPMDEKHSLKKWHQDNWTFYHNMHKIFQRWIKYLAVNKSHLNQFFLQTIYLYQNTMTGVCRNGSDAILPEVPGPVPRSHTEWFTTTCDSNSR